MNRLSSTNGQNGGVGFNLRPSSPTNKFLELRDRARHSLSSSLDSFIKVSLVFLYIILRQNFLRKKCKWDFFFYLYAINFFFFSSVVGQLKGFLFLFPSSSFQGRIYSRSNTKQWLVNRIKRMTIVTFV